MTLQIRWARIARAVGAAALVLAVARPVQAQVAVVVNAASPLNDVTSDNLKKLFNGDMPTPGGQLGADIGFHEGTQDEFFKAVFGKSGEVMRKRWATLVFQGEAVTLPKSFGDVPSVKKWVMANRFAIAFIPASAVDGSVKVVKIGGKSPGDAGYLH